MCNDRNCTAEYVHFTKIIELEDRIKELEKTLKLVVERSV